MKTLIHDTRETAFPDAPAGAGLWLDAAQIHAATGWDWKPQGLCRDDTCIPVPRGADGALVDGDRLDIAAFWAHAGWPAVHDDTERLWVLGVGAALRADALTGLEAPDFELPDLQGRLHRLSDFRGKRVFLGTWSSW